MKPFNLELILKRSLHLYKKPAGKITTLKLNIPAAKAIKSPALSPLSTNGVNVDEFCTKFNTTTANYQNTIIPVFIKIDHKKQYQIQTSKPTTTSIYRLFKFNKLKNIYKLMVLALFYKISLAKKQPPQTLISQLKAGNPFRRTYKEMSMTLFYKLKNKKKRNP